MEELKKSMNPVMSCSNIKKNKSGSQAMLEFAIARFIDFCPRMRYIYLLNSPMIAENVRNIRSRIESACVRAGRRTSEVTLVAVAKTFSSALIREVLASGVFDIGENYVQEFQRKRDELADVAGKIRWHFIGHLQSNKVKHVVEWIHLIHSIDSLRLAKEVDRQASRTARVVDVLIEVNTAGESSKFGVRAEETRKLAEQMSALHNINLAGLMTIGPFLPDPETSRPSFRLLAEVRNELQHSLGLPLPHLSMGMTNDCEIAIAEGATLVRIGTAIFGPRAKRTEQGTR
jgi:pyridoxal phosphate enzyme (YggS family)